MPSQDPPDTLVAYFNAVQSRRPEELDSIFEVKSPPLRDLVAVFAEEVASRRHLVAIRERRFPGDLSKLSRPLVVVSDSWIADASKAASRAEVRLENNSASIKYTYEDSTETIHLTRSNGGWRFDPVEFFHLEGSGADDKSTKEATIEFGQNKVDCDAIARRAEKGDFDSMAEAVLAYEMAMDTFPKGATANATQPSLQPSKRSKDNSNK
jgi:hypothetical protein